ncbi:PREDICTED: testis-specific serine/threonine-protein kinase 1-like [Bison bison bison]|uniref:non-specific serine/threonine protein kinase n=1 Tax=Bison bison bison TaxID=43346 RepID=A0A6P3GSG0_BISBB|nr:PREDICTED: testis-specific serine/threonine-protein kinase 1-like [Bison bison bison]
MDDAAVLKRRGYIMGINLGEGSYAKVKSAYSERLKFNVAVKIIDRKKAPTDFLEKFLPREIEILAMLNHRSIIKTYEIFETSDGKVYIVMELGVQGDLLDPTCPALTTVSGPGPGRAEQGKRCFKRGAHKRESVREAAWGLRAGG